MNRELIDPPAIVRQAEDDLKELAEKARNLNEACKRAGRHHVERAVALGEYLASIQDGLKERHQWVEFLRRAGIARQTASNCLIIYQERSICPTVGHMGVRGVLEFLRTGKMDEDIPCEVLSRTTGNGTAPVTSTREPGEDEDQIGEEGPEEDEERGEMEDSAPSEADGAESEPDSAPGATGAASSSGTDPRFSSSREPGEDDDQIGEDGPEGPEKPPPRDQVGVPLPEVSLPSFDVIPRFEEALTLVRKLKALADELARVPGGERWRAEECRLRESNGHQRFCSERLDHIFHALKRCQPYAAICPACYVDSSHGYKGNRKLCRVCNGFPYLDSTMWGRCSELHREAVLKDLASKTEDGGVNT